MTKTYKKYPEYKDSGVDWLGEIPSHWEIKKSKFIWQENIDLSDSEEEQLLSVSQYTGVNINKNESRGVSLMGYKRVKKDNLVINIMLAWLGGLGLSARCGIVSPAYSVYKLKENHNAKYLHYLYRTKLYLDEFARKSKGVVPSRWRMYTEDFGQVFTTLPPLSEQQKIADFLDKKTTDMDKAIAQKEEMIDLLKERKQILINKAVTRGLNPDVKLKESGIDWIGEIPEHWEVRKLKYVINGRLKYGANESGVEYNEQLPRYIRITDFSQDGSLNEENKLSLEWSQGEDFLLKDGDILFARSGATVGKTFQFKKSMSTEQHYAYAGYLIKAEPNEMIISSDYLYLYTNSPLFFKWKDGIFIKATIENIGADKYSQLPIILPSVKVQNEILDYLKPKFGKINQAIAKKQQEIETLKEYKSTLIDSAVRGKICLV